MDPQLIDEPKQGAELYKEIVKERYLISKHTNTSYVDTADISHQERNYLIQFIAEDLQRQKDMYEKAKQEMENNK